MSSREYRRAEELPWLAPLREQVERAAARNRLPHALLIHAAPGLGSEILAAWIAAFVLCDSRTGAPCGRCAACTLVAAGNHPDLMWIEREEELAPTPTAEAQADSQTTESAGNVTR